MTKGRKWAQTFWWYSVILWKFIFRSKCRHYGFKVMLGAQSVGDGWLKIKKFWNGTLEKPRLVHTSQKTLLTRGVNPPTQPKKGGYVADVTSLLPLPPGTRELHMLLLQWVPGGQAWRFPLTVWDHKKPVSTSNRSTGTWLFQKWRWYYSKLEKMSMPQSLKAFVFLFCTH